MGSLLTTRGLLRTGRVAAAAALAAACLGCAAPAAGPGGAGRAAALVGTLKDARIVDLSHTWETESPVASVNPKYGFALSATHGKTRGSFNDAGQLSFASEEMQWSGQHGAPSIDAIGHIGRDGKLFGGVDAERATSHPAGIGAAGVGAHLAIDQFPSDLLVNRGVLLDVARVVQGDGRPLPANFEITAAHLEQAARAHGVQLRRGDTVFIRTGWGVHFKGNPGLYSGEASPGPGLDAAEFLIRSGARIVGNDTLTFEKRPPVVMQPRLQVFPVHMRLIADAGVYIVENLDLEELSAARAYEFAVVVPPLKVKGGTGSAVRIFALLPR
ncbi:MAG: cyclase family protein [Ramlibacter sp.]|jgi:kynurenine formamidase|nr:cyclase family protein [Ramlibacter sp.]